MPSPAIQRLFNYLGYELARLPALDPAYRDLPDSKFYRPVFSPWFGYGDFAHFYEIARSRSVVSADRCWVLYCLALQSVAVAGDLWECGVYKGGTAAMLAEILSRNPSDPSKRLHLFDTFEGMPETDPEKDLHLEGDFADTSLTAVKEYVRHDSVVEYHQGFIPETFAGLQDARIAFAHIDVDIHRSIIDCCELIYPRLSVGGTMVFDDYGFASCPGARQAVDEFFKETAVVPLVLPTGQAVVFKSI
ncbi:MAG: TylF/MycF/NovP-related O-methyltransferase [Acidiferrobacterales bacterium]